MKIIYLTHDKINKYKWDSCIRKSFNGIVYAFSWYLDRVSSDWEALIQGDYDIVMPLTSSKKFRNNLLTQPNFTQQLGVFSTKRLNNKTVQDFIESIPEKFKYININLNTYNNIKFLDDYNISNKDTYELDLIEPYKKIEQKYSTNTKRNIKKAHKNKVSVVTNITANELLNLKKENSVISFNNELLTKIKQIISIAFIKHIGKVYGAFNANNSLCAAAFFINSHNKAIYLLGASNPEGKEIGAMTMIIDKFIRENSEKNLTLDFEGSNIESVARFFKGFGAKKCTYLNIARNNLPWYLKIFKT